MASIQYVVSATDAASAVFAKIGLSADGLDKQLEDLSKRIATPEVNLEDSKFTLGMVNAAKRLDKLSAMVANPEVDVDTGKAQLEILRISAMLDRLDAKRVSVDVAVHRSFLSRLGGIFGGGGGGGGAGGAAGGGGFLGLVRGVPGLAGAAPAGAQAAAIGGLGGLGLALGPALLPTAAGGILGVLGPLLAFPKMMKKEFGDMAAAFKQVMDPLRPLFTAVFAPLAGFVKSIGPQLRDMFKASIPFLQMFVKGFEQAGKILLPVFTQALKQMTPFLPLMAAGLLNIVQGLAGMIKAMGPGGMKASAEIFVGLCRAMEFILIGVGHAADWLAKAIMKSAHAIVVAWHWLIPAFEDFRHRTAVVFDGVRHDIAHIWDMIFQNSIGMVIRLGHNVATQFNSLRHGIANIYDGVRHDIASVWDAIWNNTIGRVIRGGHDVEAKFDQIRAQIFTIIDHLPGQLWNIAKMALENIIKGAASVVPRVKSFLSGFAHDVVQVFKNIWGWFSPSAVMYQGGKSLMTGLESGIRDHAHLAVRAASAAAHRVADAGSGVQRWSGLVSQALRMEGLSPTLLGNVLFQMNTESGGNPNIQNNWDINAQRGDPSRGLMQVIGSTFAAYHWPGTSMNIFDPLANIAAALNYARHVYGPSLMSGGMGIGSGHGYDTGGWLPPGVSLAWNMTGRPERVLGPGESGSGNTYNIHVSVPPSANKADIGRQVVETIREYERRSGAGWRR